jgi:transposase-like protein
MKLSISLIRPHLDTLKSGEMTQKRLAALFGVSQPSLSAYIARHFPDNVVGKGGSRHPATTDEMLAAVAECEDPHAVIADVARKHNLDYLALARRVKRRRDRLSKEFLAQPTRVTMPGQIPADKALDELLAATRLQDDADLVRSVLQDPMRVARLAEIIRVLKV